MSLFNNKLFKDSFWAVFGNGIGNALMLLSGIIIARFLGKDVYGEYGVVKSTMFYIASFASLGLGFTSTKYVASCVKENVTYLKSIVYDSMVMTVGFSFLIAVVLLLFSQSLANYVGLPTLSLAFRALAGVIIFKAITTTQIGILAGLKDFKTLAKNSVLSGLFLLVLCVPFTYYLGLKGSLLALLMSQIFNASINYYAVKKNVNHIENQQKKNFKKELFFCTFPVALQESSYTVTHWAAILLLTKYATVGELGLYTAAAQWNAIITMIPGLLSNVILSYLSSTVSDTQNHSMMLKKMILINFICTIIPFFIVYTLVDFITSFYGSTFDRLANVLPILALSTIFDCCSSVFKAEFLALSRTWLLFMLRLVRDVVLVVTVYIVFKTFGGGNGAIVFSWISVGMTILFFVACLSAYLVIKNIREKSVLIQGIK